MVAYWNLDEGSNTIAYDTSGNGNNASWLGSTTAGTYYTGGKVGNFSGNFNGTNNYLSLTPSFVGTLTSFTVSSWVYVPSLNGANSAQYGIYYDLNGGIGIYPAGRIYGNGKIELAAKMSGGTSVLDTPVNKISAGVWTQIVETFNASTNIASIYANGSVVGTSTFAGTLVGTAGAVVQFGHDSSASVYLLGQLDDVRIYNRALSAAEVMALYTAEK